MPQSGRSERRITLTNTMRAERLMLWFVAAVLFAAFVAILVLPHHAP